MVILDVLFNVSSTYPRDTLCKREFVRELLSSYLSASF